MIQGIERILKASIIDKVPSVSSAAIVSSYHLYSVAKDIIKRWTNEVQEAVNQKRPSGSAFSSAASTYFTAGQSKQPQIIVSNSNISQYHAISLFYLIRLMNVDPSYLYRAADAAVDAVDGVVVVVEEETYIVDVAVQYNNLHLV